MGKSKVLLISIDNLRYDCVSYEKDKSHLKKYYLDELVDTPTIDEISASCGIFASCFSTSSYTPSAHASLFTGLYPPKHGVRPFFYKTLNGGCLTIAEIYKNNGYKTVFYSDMFSLFGPLGLTRGFDYTFDKNFTGFMELLESFKEEKVFAFIHLFDVHEPYIFSEVPPDKNYNDDYLEFIRNISYLYNIPVPEAASGNPYAMWNAVAPSLRFGHSFLLAPFIYGANKFDKGRFRLIYNSLKNLSYFDKDNIFAVFSDHGEGRISLLDKQVLGHMGELFDEIIHVPLIFHAPGVESKIYDKPASITDIFPALVSFSGLAADSKNLSAEIDGVSLFEERAFCYSEYYIQNVYNEIRQYEAAGFDRSKLGVSAQDKYVLAQRCIRTAGKKYIFMPDRLSPEESRKITDDLSLSDEDYIISLLSYILRKRIAREEYLHLLNLLKTKKASRQDIFKTAVSFPEYKRPLNYYYDLVNDPYETKPLAFSGADLTAVETHIKFLKDLEAQAVDTPDAFGSFNINRGKNIPEEGARRAGETGNNEANAPLLKSKTAFSEEIIKEAYSRFGDKAAIAFTGGKDSTVLLDLTRKAFNGTIPFKVITIDTSAEFPEITQFMDRLKKEWNFDIKVYRNLEALKYVSIAQNRQECCELLKTTPIKNAIKDLGLKALLTGIRKDEQEARANEIYFSERQDPHHFRVHPILHFTESDIWDYIKLNNIPFCSLYEQGYRSIDCKPCTEKSKEGEAERSGRSKEKDEVMGRLRDAGYF